VHERVDLGGKQRDMRVGLQVLDRLRVGQRSMPARFGEERDVIAAPLIAVGAAQIHDLCVDAGAEARIGEVRARRRGARRGNFVRPFLGPVRDEPFTPQALQF